MHSCHDAGLLPLGVPGGVILQLSLPNINQGRGRLCPPNNNGTPGFLNLPTGLSACYKLNGRRSFGCTQTKLFDKGMYVWIAQRLKILTVFFSFDD